MKGGNLTFALLLCLVGLAPLSGCPPRPLRAGDTRTFDGIQFQWCPAGTFDMGSPSDEPGRSDGEVLHEVTLTKGFWLSRYEIAQAQWEDVMGENPSEFAGEDRPVEHVSWDDVQEFLTLMNTAKAGSPYRLPTEAQWEYACRAGTTTRFYWGDDFGETEIDDNAWYQDNGNNETHPVGEKDPNPWGLHDMIGNVREWCQDFYREYPETAETDPKGPDVGDEHAIRGGSWEDEPYACRAASRQFRPPDAQLGFLGFRLLREQD